MQSSDQRDRSARGGLAAFLGVLTLLWVGCGLFFAGIEAENRLGPRPWQLWAQLVVAVTGAAFLWIAYGLAEQRDPRKGRYWASAAGAFAVWLLLLASLL